MPVVRRMRIDWKAGMDAEAWILSPASGGARLPAWRQFFQLYNLRRGRTRSADMDSHRYSIRRVAGTVIHCY